MVIAAERFAGLPLSTLTRAEVVRDALAAVASRRRLTITFLNPDYVRRALGSASLAADVETFDLVLADGNGVRWLTRLFGFKTPERVDTDSLVPDLLRALAERQGRVFLFGCAPGVAERSGERFVAAFPGLRVVGTEHGFHDVVAGHRGRFAEADVDRILADVAAAGPDLLLVSLPTPMQQQWARFTAELDVPIVMTGGSYLDHAAAAERFPERWYPAWADRYRLNWFYRLLQEPRRLWRRYTVEMAQFAVLVLRQRLSEALTRRSASPRRS